MNVGDNQGLCPFLQSGVLLCTLIVLQTLTGSRGGTKEDNEISAPFASAPLSSRPLRIILISSGMATFYFKLSRDSSTEVPGTRYRYLGCSKRTAFLGTAPLPGSGELAVPENEFGRDRYASKPTLHLQKGSGHPVRRMRWRWLRMRW